MKVGRFDVPGHYTGDCRELLQELPEGCIQTCVSSPPYWGLRSYLNDGNPAKASEIGLEPTPDAYVASLVEVFRGVRRALRDDGTLWLNLGDSYASAAGGYDENGSVGATSDGRISRKTQAAVVAHRGRKPPSGLKAKDLVGIPWMVAFALRADGWYLRQDIVWCLSGGTWVYARTQKGDMPITIKDLARLRPDTVQLWNGTRWTRLLGMSRSLRRGTEIEIVLRSGERISCTPTHRFPTSRGQPPLRLDRRIAALRRRALRDVPAQADRAVHPRRLASGRPGARPVLWLGHDRRRLREARAALDRLRPQPRVRSARQGADGAALADARGAAVNCSTAHHREGTA